MVLLHDTRYLLFVAVLTLSRIIKSVVTAVYEMARVPFMRASHCLENGIQVIISW